MGMVRRSGLVVLPWTPVLTVVAACGVAESVTTETVPSASPSVDVVDGDITVADFRASCSGLDLGPAPADYSHFPPVEPTAYVFDLVGFDADFTHWFDEYDWFVAEETDETLTLFGTRRESGVTQPGRWKNFAAAWFNRGEAAVWKINGATDCDIELSTLGWGVGRFVLDPEQQPDPASSTISVRAWELACANGQLPIGRDVRSVVLDADVRSVSIVVLIDPLEGGADCPGNPGFPLDVDLGEPLGDRTVLDASVQPGVERPWPPTESSLQWMGIVY
jgi:hypothetical protein